jgi:hypothetical protein
MNKCETIHPRPSGSENQDHRCCLRKLFRASGTCSQAQRFWVSFQISCNPELFLLESTSWACGSGGTTFRSSELCIRHIYKEGSIPLYCIAESSFPSSLVFRWKRSIPCHSSLGRPRTGGSRSISCTIAFLRGQFWNHSGCAEQYLASRNTGTYETWTLTTRALRMTVSCST